ncbi:MAG: fibronectin type III domain-containing protein [Limisphaerales bacterium]
MIRKAKFLSFLFLVQFCLYYTQTASGLELAWDASPTTVSGYFVHTVDAGNSKTTKTDVGNTTTAVINSLSPSHVYSIYVTAYDSSRNESKPSNTVSYIMPPVAGSPPPASLLIDNNEKLWIKGSPSINYGIQATSDFKQWNEVGQVTGASNPVAFSEGALSNAQMRFYRVVPKSP